MDWTLASIRPPVADFFDGLEGASARFSERQLFSHRTSELEGLSKMGISVLRGVAMKFGLPTYAYLLFRQLGAATPLNK